MALTIEVKNAEGVKVGSVDLPVSYTHLTLPTT